MSRRVATSPVDGDVSIRWSDARALVLHDRVDERPEFTPEWIEFDEGARVRIAVDLPSPMREGAR